MTMSSSTNVVHNAVEGDIGPPLPTSRFDRVWLVVETLQMRSVWHRHVLEHVVKNTLFGNDAAAIWDNCMLCNGRVGISFPHVSVASRKKHPYPHANPGLPACLSCLGCLPRIPLWLSISSAGMHALLHPTDDPTVLDVPNIRHMLIAQ